MAAVPRHLVLADFFRCDEWETVVFPLREAAAHGVNVGISEILKSLGCQSRSDPAGAIDNDRLIFVCQGLVGFYFEKAAREKEGLVQMTLFPFVAFAYIEKGKTILRIQLIVNFLDGYFLNLISCLSENLFKVAHR